MRLMKKLMLSLGLVSAIGFSTTASAIPFTVTDAAFYAGSGYGDETTYRCGLLNLFTCTTDTQLDVNFSTGLFTQQNFSLDTVGASKTFNFGTINLQEVDISNAETDNLGVTARLTFSDPLGIIASIIATGTVNTGPVDDRGQEKDDYFLNWDTAYVDFGGGGRFSIDLADLVFNRNQTITETAKVTLLALPASAQVPEPATLAMLGIGLLGLGAVRRRKS